MKFFKIYPFDMTCNCCKEDKYDDQFWLDSKDYLWNSLCVSCRRLVLAVIYKEHRDQMRLMTLEEKKTFYSPEIKKTELPPWITPIEEIIKEIQKKL